MLELFKPYIWLEDKNKTLIFNELEQFYIPRYKYIKPFIIFYDENEDSYYYIKARIANKNFPERKLNEEVFIPTNISIDYRPINKGIMTSDIWVDCSQIFKCGRELMESLVDIDNELYKNTECLEKNIFLKFLKK